MREWLDRVIAAVGLVVLSPLLLVVAVLVRFRLGSPVIFRQIRPGLHGRPFELYKFRTMKDAVDEHRRPLGDMHRMTSLGTRLRALSLDELPTLVNVARGDMALVGPRPLLMEYLKLYTPEQARRNDVRPGVTGWAQVNGRNSLSWEDKFRHDIWYVDHRSFMLDAKIILLTFKKVFARDGISADGHVTIEKFGGTRR